MVLLGGCQFLPKEEVMLAPPLIAPEEITYQTILPRQGRIEDVIAGTAYFTPVKVHNYKYDVSGNTFGGYEVKTGDNVKAGDVLATLVTKDLSQSIAKMQLEVDSMRAALSLRKETNAMELAQAQKDLEVLIALSASAYEQDQQLMTIRRLEMERDYSIRIDENQLALKQMDLSELISESTASDLIAEFDGVVTYVADVNEGDVVNGYTTMVTVADPNQMQLQYNGTLASEFALGMAVEVSVAGQDYEGQVVFVPNMAPKESSETYRNIVRIEVAGLEGPVLSGQSAQFKVLLDEADDTIVVTRKVLQKVSGKDVIYTLEEGLRVENYVKVGVEGTGEVEIISGIDLSDVMIMD